MVKNLPVNAGDTRDVGLIPGSGRSPGGYGNPLQYSCLENSMDRKARRATACRVTESRTRLNAKLVWPHTYEINLQRLGCQIRVRVLDMKKKCHFSHLAPPVSLN